MLSSSTRIIIAIVFIMHGIGHAMGILAVLGVQLSETHSADSWLLNGIIGTTGSKVAGFLIWLPAIALFAGAGLGLLGWIVPQSMWRGLAIAGAVISFTGLVLFWNAFPFLFPNKIGVIAIDSAVLVSLLMLRWPPAG